MMPPRKPKLDARTADYVQFFTTDGLRRVWRAMAIDDEGTTLRAWTGARTPDDRTPPGSDITISRADLEAVILWRVWWERFGYYLLLIGAVAAVIAAIEGALPTGTSSGVQSPSGGSVVPVLSLVVAILAVFFGPLIARANTQRQLQVAAREAWMREFREQVAALLNRSGVLIAEGSTAPFDPEMTRYVYVIRMLIAEKGEQYAPFVGIMNRLLGTPTFMDQLAAAATDILRQERAAAAEDPGVWREVWISLGLDAVAWPAWSRRPTHRGESGGC